MPLQFGRECKPRIFDVQDATVLDAGGSSRCVKEQWPHKQSVACSGGAEEFRMLGAKFPNSFSGHATTAVRTGDNTQSAVGFVRIIEMNTHSEHLFEKFSRWLRVRDSVFNAP